MDIRPGVALQSPVPGPEHCARQVRVRSGRSPDLPVEFVFVRRFPEHHQRCPDPRPCVGPGRHHRVVLRLPPGHVQHIAVPDDLRGLRRDRERVTVEQVSAVRNHHRVGVVPGPVVRPDLVRVRHKHAREPNRQPFAHPVPRPARDTPFAPAPFQAVHVQDRSPSREPEKHKNRGVRRVTQDHVFGAARQNEMHRGQERVHDRVQIFALDRRESHQTDPAPRLPAGRVRGPAVDGHVHAPIDQVQREAFRERLEPAVVRRDTPGPEDRNSPPGPVPGHRPDRPAARDCGGGP